MKDNKESRRHSGEDAPSKPQTDVASANGKNAPSNVAGKDAAAATAAPAKSEAKPDELVLLKDQFLRLQADFDNFRKRTVRDRSEQARQAVERILRDLLPVIDHFEMGLEQAHKQHIKHAVIDGFTMVHGQLLTVLEGAGVSTIKTEGEKFDPQVHEPVYQEHSDLVPENVIVRETRRGYRMGAYLLRAPQVVVSLGPVQPSAEPPPTEDVAAEDNDI